jgi:hypothetical protein
MYVIVVAFALSSCATNVPKPVDACPALPQMGSDETLIHYTQHIIDLYDECSKSKGGS